MDFSRLHTYTPPHCLPENTGYTYALSSSYSSSALDFEAENKIDPVFDSPRMSRRSLRLAAAAGYSKSDDGNNDTRRDSSSSRNKSFREQSSQMTWQCRSKNKQSGGVRDTPRRNSSIYSQSSLSSHTSDTSTVLDQSLIREQTEVDHFWGLDDEGDPGGSDTTLMQRNGDTAAVEVQGRISNGYTCNECSLLSERKETLTAYSASHVPSPRIYSRDRSQKHGARGTYFYVGKILRLVSHAAASFASLLVQLFEMVLLKLGYDFKAPSDYCGGMNVKEFYREDSHLGVNEDSICDDCKGKKHLEIHTTDHMQSSWAKRVARTIWHTFSYTGRAASGMLRSGWCQLATLLSSLKVFLLRRYLSNSCELLLIITLLSLLGVWFWGFDGFTSLVPSLNWAKMDRLQRRDDSLRVSEPQADSFRSVQPPKDINIFDPGRISELEKQLAFLSDKYHHDDDRWSKAILQLNELQDQVAQMSDKNETLELIKNVVGQHLKDMKQKEQSDFLALYEERELTILTLKELLAKLSAEFKAVQKEVDIVKAKPMRDDYYDQLLSRVQMLEQELSRMKSELSTEEYLKTSCEKIDAINEKVDAQVKESVRLMLFGDQPEDLSKSFLQWLASNYVSKSDLQTLLLDLELKILRNITLHVSGTDQKLLTEVVTNTMTKAGISGVTAAQAQMIVDNALKLYSQDKTALADFALESGGGSILSTRCSETYQTRTAVVSIFGIPVMHHTNSPRVVIQPDIYPGNCWAFKGSLGYLVIQLSRKIYPTSFALEHIPKALSPSGNIFSAPRNFEVYGLDDEYQEGGTLLGQYLYDQEGEPLQMFPVMETMEKAFQTVELRILSNWGNPNYTCLYRFRVHGKLAE